MKNGIGQYVVHLAHRLAASPAPALVDQAVTAEQWVALLEQHAPRLREVGVLELSVDGASAKLAPRDPPAPAATEREEEPVDPMLNPALYPGGIVPGYDRPEGDDA